MTRLASAHVTASGRLYMREMERENGVRTEEFNSNEYGEYCVENINHDSQLEITNKMRFVIYAQNNGV